MKKKKYIPTCLKDSWRKEQRPEGWGVGIHKNTNEVGMNHGPFDTEKEALEIVGLNKEVIIHFHKNSAFFDISWKWSTKGYWKKLKS